MQNNLKRQKFIVTSVILFLAFTYPIVSIVNHERLLGGIPLLFLYFLVVWIAGIILLYWLADYKSKKPNE